MGWQDRDYAREDAYGGYVRGGGGGVLGAFFGGGIVQTLLILNIGVYVLCLATGGDVTARQGGSWLYRIGELSGDSIWKHGEIWRILTCTFLHANFMHLFMNMFGLYMFGQVLEPRYGPRGLLKLYLLSGILANLFYLLLALPKGAFLAPNGGYFASGIPLIGASGCVLGLLGAAAVAYPSLMVYLYAIFPLKIRTVALLLGLWYVYSVVRRQGNFGGNACHLVGLLTGAWWAWSGQDWWRGRGAPVWARMKRLISFRRPTDRDGEIPSQARRTSTWYRPSDVQADRAEVDRILKKIHDFGLHALSEQERKTLRDATERLQADYRN